MKIRIPLLALSLGLTANVAEAQYINRGNGMIYDPTRNLTWIADLNYAVTSKYTAPGVTADGRMTWSAANTWANNLVFGGFDDWRMPTLNPTDPTCSHSTAFAGFPNQSSGNNCTGGELSGLFITGLGHKPNQSLLNQTGDTAEQIANLALFSNFTDNVGFWSGTVFAPLPGTNAFGFAWNAVQSFGVSQSDQYLAVAVRTGDVAAVPEPSTSALIAAGLAGLLAVGRRRRADA